VSWQERPLPSSEGGLAGCSYEAPCDRNARFSPRTGMPRPVALVQRRDLDGGLITIGSYPRVGAARQTNRGAPDANRDTTSPHETPNHVTWTAAASWAVDECVCVPRSHRWPRDGRRTRVSYPPRWAHQRLQTSRGLRVRPTIRYQSHRQHGTAMSRAPGIILRRRHQSLGRRSAATWPVEDGQPSAGLCLANVHHTAEAVATGAAGKGRLRSHRLLAQCERSALRCW